MLAQYCTVRGGAGRGGEGRLAARAREGERAEQHYGITLQHDLRQLLMALSGVPGKGKSKGVILGKGLIFYVDFGEIRALYPENFSSPLGRAGHNYCKPC